MYVLFVERSGRRVAGAYYFSLLSGRSAPVYVEGEKKSWLDRETMDAFVATSVERIGSMADAIVAGDYRVRSAAGGCDGCRARPICRQRYAIRQVHA